MTPCLWELEELQIGTHDVRDSTDLGGGPKIVHRRFLAAPELPEGLQRDIDPSLVAKFEAVGDCLCRGVHLEGRSADRIFLHAEMKSSSGHALGGKLSLGERVTPERSLDVLIVCTGVVLVFVGNR